MVCLISRLQQYRNQNHTNFRYNQLLKKLAKLNYYDDYYNQFSTIFNIQHRTICGCRKKQNLENLCNGGEIFTLVSREWSLTVAFQLTAELETF